MTIYEIDVDAKYQWVMPNVPESEILDFVMFNAKAKNHWRDIKWYIFNPMDPKGDFYTIGSSSAFAFNQAVYDSPLFDLFELSGEIIPIICGNEKLYILNILVCPNMLDSENSVFDLYEDGSLGTVTKPIFYEDRITESSIFKIPEMNSAQILTYTGVKDFDTEFKYLYEKLGFKGLIFEEIYSS